MRPANNVIRSPSKLESTLIVFFVVVFFVVVFFVVVFFVVVRGARFFPITRFFFKAARFFLCMRRRNDLMHREVNHFISRRFLRAPE